MTEEQIRRGIWYGDRETNWCPEAITHFKRYVPKERLSLNITQLSTSHSQQNKIVKTWCNELPELTEVKYLWFFSRVNQAMFEAACEMINLEGLFIKWSGIKNIDSIIKLKNLKHLHIGSSGQIQSIKIFKEINSITTLGLENLNKISDFTDISEMTNLEGLGIDGSMWTTQNIETLKPLENLKKLMYLTLTNTKIKDKSFDSILKLTELIRFDSSWNYPEKEFEKLKLLSNLRYGNIETSWKEIKEKMKISYTAL